MFYYFTEIYTSQQFGAGRDCIQDECLGTLIGGLLPLHVWLTPVFTVVLSWKVPV